MRIFFENLSIRLSSIAGLIGGLIWAMLSHWDPEPIILMVTSLITIIGWVGVEISKQRKKNNLNATESPTDIIVVIQQKGDSVKYDSLKTKMLDHF